MLPIWFLGFDCATKTFAFSLSRIDYIEINRRVREFEIISELLKRTTLQTFFENYALVKKTNKELRELIQIVDGETVDLFPGVKNDEIDAVSRIKAVVCYVETRILPLLISLDGNLKIVIEYQMDINHKTNLVSSALITLFSKYDVVVVGPSLKNKISVCDEGKYENFTEKTISTYIANKQHALFNFQRIENLFGSRIKRTKLHGHIADSFMQILGYLKYQCNIDQHSMILSDRIIDTL